MHVGLVVLVGDVAHDLLDHILERGQSVRAAEFIHHNREVNLFRLHLREEGQRRHGRRHEKSLADELCRGDGGFQRGPAQLKALRRFPGALIGSALRHPGDGVLDVHHSDRVIEALPEHRHARMADAREQVQKLGDGLVLLDGDDIRAGNHHFGDLRLPELQDVEEHVPLLLRQGIRLLRPPPSPVSRFRAFRGGLTRWRNPNSRPCAGASLAMFSIYPFQIRVVEA